MGDNEVEEVEDPPLRNKSSTLAGMKASVGVIRYTEDPGQRDKACTLWK